MPMKIFYFRRLKQIKDFHRRHPGEISVPMSVEFEELKKMRENPPEETTMVQFR
jgi:splicing factor 3A subunit 3